MRGGGRGRRRPYLVDLGFEVTGEGEAMTVTPPPWRGDIDGEADLIEEIVRINGLTKLKRFR